MPAFDETYAALRRLMLKAAPRMRVVRDDGRELILHSQWTYPMKPREPIWFGAVRSAKSYVSYHLMPLYADAKLASGVGPALLSRMQGKSCFNFTHVDRENFGALATLRRQCVRAYARPPLTHHETSLKGSSKRRSTKRRT
jgi:hypothetical protein